LNVVKPSYGLSDDEVAAMLKEGFASAESDMARRSLREAQVEAERMALAAESALAADGDLLDDDERAAIVALVAQARETAQHSTEARAVEAATEALAQGTEGFAAARMNRGIRAALAGRSVDSL
jgi:molecular chaperone HscA